MPKLKTQKSVAKRVKITKGGKLKQRTAGGSHFNTRLTGRQTQKKRQDKDTAAAEQKNIKNMLPYHK